MGAVYLVEHVHTGEHLALKVLLAQEALNVDAIERFKREARAPAKIKSEHVVRVTDADVAPELGGAPFMVMELLQGKDLEAVVRQRRIPPEEVCWILNQLAVALDKAHAIGIVHRDLKPENLFLHTREDGSQIVKILDFGISKMREKDGGDMQAAGLTQTGAVMGTPLYMSPEQARGQGTVGPQSDVWALGLVTLRLLTSAIYWHADTLADLLMKIMVDPLDLPSKRFPDLSINIDAWFLKSCERDLSRRFASIGEQVRAFNAVVAGGSISAPNPAGGTMMIGPQPAQHTFQQAQRPQHTGPQLPPAQPTASHGSQGQTGPNAPPMQQGPSPLSSSSSSVAQTGDRSSQPFVNLQSTTSGAGAMVRPNPGSPGMVEPSATTTSSRAGLIGGLVALAVVAVGVGAVVVVPRLRHASGTTTPSASVTMSAEPLASASAPASAQASSATSAVASASAPPVATPPSAVATTIGKPPPTHGTATTAKSAATAQPTAVVTTKPTGQTPTAKPSNGKFNPEAP